MHAENDTELIPGTELVFRGTAGEADSSQELVLVPRPTSNSDDPLVSSLCLCLEMRAS